MRSRSTDTLTFDAAEQVKQVLDEKLAERAKFYEGLKVQIADLSSKKEDAEITAEKCKRNVVSCDTLIGSL